MPLSLLLQDGSGVAAHFPLPAAGLTWDRLRNQQVNLVDSQAALEALCLSVRPDGEPSTILEGTLWPVSGGWKSCFATVKNQLRRSFDLSCITGRILPGCVTVCCATCLRYGDECFDAAAGVFDMNRLLDAGEAFGGYDAVLIWHQYPRLGLDARSQWDFFDDFPGGLSDLRTAVEAAHARGTRVLLPFKPWDRAIDDSDRDSISKLCRVLKATDADGSSSTR
jgi:hypothetical protein